MSMLARRPPVWALGVFLRHHSTFSQGLWSLGSWVSKDPEKETCPGDTNDNCSPQQRPGSPLNTFPYSFPTLAEVKAVEQVGEENEGGGGGRRGRPHLCARRPRLGGEKLQITRGSERSPDLTFYYLKK